MLISNLGIPDSTVKDIDEYKTRFADDIVSAMIPFVNKEVSEKLENLKKLRKNVKRKSNQIILLKKQIDSTRRVLDRKRKVKILLDRASKLVALKALDDDNVKREMTVMLKIIDDLPEEKIDFYVSEMMRIITNKFSKIETSNIAED